MLPLRLRSGLKAFFAQHDSIICLLWLNICATLFRVLSSKLKTVEIVTGIVYILPNTGDLIKTLLVEATPKQAFDELRPGFEGATQYSINNAKLIR